MYFLQKIMLLFLIAFALVACKDRPDKKDLMTITADTEYYLEPYRPQFHFSPEEKWMNDPNGMVYHNGTYHLFYQYHPDDIVWGPMHWGHAVSKDLMHWQHKPIALYPDSLGYIFSGSAVLDKNNTSGFGTDENPPLVAIFTYHDAEKRKVVGSGFETQGIAYSLDDGDTWFKYDGNPVISAQNSTDFRDPKVMWHEQTKKWVLTLVAGDHAEFYGSKDLKEWELLSEFGRDMGAHGGVWECPDLFKLQVENSDKEKWVLLISINPGAPNGGSGTQYFIGDFDGKKFTSDQMDAQWVDWGTDNYAGVTYSNAPNDETIFIGWMSNWLYANKTPTSTWRSAMTLPRTLSLQKSNDTYILSSYPVKNLDTQIDRRPKKKIELEPGSMKNIDFDHFNQSEVRFVTTAKDFELTFKNKKEEELVLTLDGEEGQFLLDRTQSGRIDFQKDFALVAKMPVDDLPSGPYEVRILMDQSSVEVFLNGGQYVMTGQLFPTENYNSLEIANTSSDMMRVFDFELGRVKRVW